MSNVTQTDDRSSTVDICEIPQDVVLEVFSNQRRRFTIHYLKQETGNQITVSDLAEQVASWENNKQIAQLTHQERKRVRNALRQFHLPKMADYGFIEYDSKRGTVSLTATTANTNFYIDTLTGRDIPWGVYYLAVSTGGVACLIGLWVGLYPFSLLSPFSYSVFFTIFILCSSLGHFYDNYYRMRLGARETPLEVDTE